MTGSATALHVPLNAYREPHEFRVGDFVRFTEGPHQTWEVKGLDRNNAWIKRGRGYLTVPVDWLSPDSGLWGAPQ